MGQLTGEIEKVIQNDGVDQRREPAHFAVIRDPCRRPAHQTRGHVERVGRAQIVQFQGQMAEYGIAPGSALARRLFS